MAMMITHAGLGLRIAELLAVEFKMSTSCDEQCVSSDSFRQTGSRRVPPITPRSQRMLALPNVVAEFRYGKDRKSGAKVCRCGRQTSTAASITVTSSKTASATLKAVS
jgi:hypothetical protein